MKVDRIDHVVFTVRDVDRSAEFYSRVLGMQVVTFADDRKALVFGRQKINLHSAGKEREPKALRPTPGSGDLCLITDRNLDDVITHVGVCRVAIVEGPVRKTGALGPISSIYVRDPDGNLIEVANYVRDVA